jgi:hypothetical protein
MFVAALPARWRAGQATRMQLDQAQAPTMANRTGAPVIGRDGVALRDVTASIPGAALRRNGADHRARLSEAGASGIWRKPPTPRHRAFGGSSFSSAIASNLRGALAFKG